MTYRELRNTINDMSELQLDNEIEGFDFDNQRRLSIIGGDEIRNIDGLPHDQFPWEDKNSRQFLLFLD